MIVVSTEVHPHCSTELSVQVLLSAPSMSSISAYSTILKGKSAEKWVL